MAVYKKLHEIQTKVNGLLKDKKSFSYSYVTGDKVLKFIRPLMNELGLLLKQEVLSIENVRMDYTAKSGPKSEILSKVMMRFTWVDIETGEKDVNDFGANGQNEFEKGLGSALTYAERYFLLKYFHIPTDEDDIDNDLRKKIDGEPENKPADSKPARNSSGEIPKDKAPAIKILKTGTKAWESLVERVSKGETITKVDLLKFFDLKEVEKELESLNIF